MVDVTPTSLLRWLPLLPLLGAVVNGLFGRRLPPRLVHTIAVGVMAVSAGIAALAVAELLRLPPGAGAPPEPNLPGLLERRHATLGPNLSISYRRPLHVVRGWMQHLYDARGRHVRAIANERFAPGPHELAVWTTDAEGRTLTSGVYFLRMASVAGESFEPRTSRLVVLP